MTTVNDGHTPTPWNLHPHYDGELLAVGEADGRPGFVAASLIIAKGDKIIAEVKMSTAQGGFGNVDSEAEMRANAALILEACNSHASSLATIEALKRELEEAKKIIADLSREKNETKNNIPDDAIVEREFAKLRLEMERYRVRFPAKALLSDQPAKEDSQ